MRQNVAAPSYVKVAAVHVHGEVADEVEYAGRVARQVEAED